MRAHIARLIKSAGTLKALDVTVQAPDIIWVLRWTREAVVDAEVSAIDVFRLANTTLLEK